MEDMEDIELVDHELLKANLKLMEVMEVMEDMEVMEVTEVVEVVVRAGSHQPSLIVIYIKTSRHTGALNAASCSKTQHIIESAWPRLKLD